MLLSEYQPGIQMLWMLLSEFQTKKSGTQMARSFGLQTQKRPVFRRLFPESGNQIVTEFLMCITFSVIFL